MSIFRWFVIFVSILILYVIEKTLIDYPDQVVWFIDTYLIGMLLTASIGGTASFYLTRSYIDSYAPSKATLYAVFISSSNGAFLYLSLCYLYAWNRFSNMPVFEARFTLSATLFAVTLYVKDKVGLGIDVRDYIFKSDDDIGSFPE